MRTTFAKAYGIKVRCYGEHVGEHFGNLRNILRTHWELERNIVGTHWEPGGNGKKILPPTSTLKGKKSKALWLHAWAFTLAAWNFSSPKSSSPFWCGLIPRAKNILPIGGTYSVSHLLVGDASQVQLLLCCNKPFWSSNHTKKLKLWRGYEIEDSVGGWHTCPFGPAK